MTTKAGWLTKSSRLPSAISATVLNQILSSGTSVAFAIYLVRTLSPEMFGLYGIGMAVTFLYGGIGNGLILTQMAVRLPELKSDQVASYTGRMFVYLVLFCAGTLAVVGLTFGTSATYYRSASQHFPLILAITGGATSSLLKDFFLRHAFNVRRETRALAINSASATTLLGILVVAHVLQAGLTAVQALWIYALSQIVGAIWGFRSAALSLQSISCQVLRRDVLSAWVGGKWAVGGVLVTWLQSQAYVYISAIFLGPLGVAVANAGRLLVAPILLLNTAFNQLALPALSSARVQRAADIGAFGALYTAGSLALSLLYVGALAVFFDTVSVLIIGEQYKDIGSVTTVWCIVLVLQVARSGASVLLQALKDFRFLTLANLWTAGAAIATATVLAAQYGVIGAISGTAVGELLLALLLWRKVARNG